MQNDPYFKKQIEYKFQRKTYRFNVANEIFSTFKIDRGTAFLLNTILREKPSAQKFKKILDIGCGYGPLGIILTDYFTNAHTVMVDKDLLAVKYAQSNATLNKISNRTEIFGSVGLEKVDNDKFDLIVSNIPAKIGDEAIEKEFILKPIARLSENGEYWCVVVSGLNRLIPTIASKNTLTLTQAGKRKGHTVYRCIKH